MKDQETELSGSVDQAGKTATALWTPPSPEPSDAVRSYRRTGTALNEAISAYAALILADGLTGWGLDSREQCIVWKYDLERQQLLCCMYRLSVFATGESAESDRAVITAAVKRLIARDVSLPLTAQEFTELGVEE